MDLDRRPRWRDKREIRAMRIMRLGVLSEQIIRDMGLPPCTTQDALQRLDRNVKQRLEAING